MGKGGMSSRLASAMSKPKTKRGKRFLENRAPKVHENAKNLIVLRGSKTTQGVSMLLEDMVNMRKPLVVKNNRRQNDLHPFENVEPVEYLCRKNDTSLFAYGSSSKKRPFRLMLGRTFDSELLDMQEYKVSDFKGSVQFGKAGNSWLLGSKPMMVFQGAAFDHDDEMKRAKSLLLDVFRGPKAEKVSLMGLTRVVVCTALDGDEKTIQFKHYKIVMKKSGVKMPHVQLEEMGPRFKLQVDRQRSAVPERWKAALKTPKELKPKKQKNVTTNVLGQTKGRVHVGKQKLEKVYTHLSHTLKNRALESKPKKKKVKKTE